MRLVFLVHVFFNISESIIVILITILNYFTKVNYFTGVRTRNTSHINYQSYGTTTTILALKIACEYDLVIGLMGLRIQYVGSLPVLNVKS